MRSQLSTPVRTAADLFDLWERLMGPGGFARSSVWVIFLDESGRPRPVIMPVDDIPPEPEPVLVRNLARVIADVLDDGPGGVVALLLSRDGPAAMTDADRRWARTLHAAFGRELSPWPVHLATRGRIQVFAPDDLIAA